MFDSSLMAIRNLPSMDAGFRHPCRNDGDNGQIKNDKKYAARRNPLFYYALRQAFSPPRPDNQ
jgi:hypothetical protein